MHFPFKLQEKGLRRLRKTGLVVLISAILIGVLVLALTPVLKQQIETRGSAALGRNVTLGKLALHPLTLAVELSDLRVATADGTGAQFEVGRLYTEVSWESLWRLAPVVDAIQIERPRAQITRTALNHYDIDDIVARFQPDPKVPPPPATGMPRLALYNIELQDGAVDFTDRIDGKVRHHALHQLNFSLPFLSTLPSKRDVLVKPRLAFDLNGSSFDTDAQAKPFAEQRAGDATLNIAHLDLAPYLSYLPASLPVKLTAGTLDSSLSFHFVQTTESHLQIGGKLVLSQVQLTEPGGAGLLKFDALEAELGDVAPLERKVHLQSLTLKQPAVQVTRNASGVLNWLRLATPAKAGGVASNDVAKTESAASSASAAPAWQFSLDKLALQQGNVQWRDQSVAPAAALDARIDLAMQQLVWPADAARPAQLKGTLSVSSPGAHKAANLELDGHGTPDVGTANLRLADLDLGLTAPYVAQYVVPSVRGVAAAQMSADWKAGQVKAVLQQLSVRDFALVPAANAVLDLPSFQSLELQNLSADLSARQITLGRVTLQSPRLQIVRDADGGFQFSHWLRDSTKAPQAADTKAAATKPAAERPWAVMLSDISLKDGRVGFTDQQPVRPASLLLSNLQFQARNVTLEGKQPAPVRLQMDVRSGRTEPGKFLFDGNVKWAPVQVDGRVDAAQLPVQFIAPYLMDKMRIELVRADTSFKGQVHYADQAAGPDVQVQGDVAVEDMKANSFNALAKSGSGTEGAETLVSWTRLSIPGVSVNLHGSQAPQIQLGDIALSDFYFRLIVDPNGHLVLQDLVKGAGPADAKESVASAAPNAVIDAGPIRLINGQVAFSDRFIQPNYSAELTELNGTLGRISSRPQTGLADVGALTLHGRVQGSALLDIVGRVNPLARPLDLDLQARVRDLELSPLSSYAVKYSGYGIERGKLSVDLNYRVTPDSKLSASNHIVLNQLTFGEAVPGAPGSLPVKLATALLSDRNGVINLNLPITGSLNDPQFSIWPVVWKIVGNLITKALTAPFSLFSSGAGDVGDLSNVSFNPGTAVISAQGRSVLDHLAHELQDRPALKLTMVGTASADAEDAAIRRARLNALLLAEKRRQAGAAATDTIEPVTPEQYPTLLKAVYRRTDMTKPRNLVGLARDLEPAQMEALLLANISVTPDAVRTLAVQRGVAVRDYLGNAGLASERLYLGAEKTAAGGDNWTPQVELTIAQP